MKKIFDAELVAKAVMAMFEQGATLCVPTSSEPFAMGVSVDDLDGLLDLFQEFIETGEIRI